MKPGNVVFIMHNDNIISKAIAWFMRDGRDPCPDWSHSALVVDISEKDSWLSETTDTQIAYGRLSTYMLDDKCDVEIYEPVGVDDAAIEAGIKEAQNNSGKLYAYWQLISFAVVCLFAKIRIDIPNLLPFGWVCNSHVLDGIKLYPIAPFSGIKPSSIHTMKMYRMMRVSPNWKLVHSKRSLG